MTANRARRPIRLAATVVAFALLGAAPVLAQTEAQGRILAEALEEARSGNWTAAAAKVERARSPVAADLVLWTRLREGVGTFGEYESFMARNPSWPGLALLRRQGERLIPADAAPANVIAFFDGEPPRTGTGAIRLADAMARRGLAAQALTMVLRVWPDLSLNRDEQAAILARWGDALRDHHVARLDTLLWNERLTEAELMLPLVDAGWRALAEARIGLRRDVGNTTQLINAVPAAMLSDPGLAFERFQWRVRKGRWEDAEAWLLQHSTSAASLGRPDMWMTRRPGLARQALRRGDLEAAYRIAAENFGSRNSGADYAEAEWFAGYLALTRMDDPERAIRHFQRFERAVATPISLGRAGFWLGLAHERAGDGSAAHEAWLRGARHQTSFYGQLAAEKARVGPDATLAARGVPDWRRSPIMDEASVQAGYLLHLAGDESRALVFFRHAARNMGADDRAALAQMQIDLGRMHLGVRLAKDAAAAGIIIPVQYYPTHDMAQIEWAVPTEFALAVARQESEFNPAAVSHAGARGLMQLMPGTAQQVAGSLGIEYSERRLVSDPMYNARLGTTYLAKMLRNYGGSYVLAAAAYNAGPGRVSQWIQDFGDPRRPEVDTLLWIESIPFTETRNYVMRVLEALHVYRARLNGRTQPVRLVADINRTG